MDRILQAKARGDWKAVNEASLSRVWQHTQKAGETAFTIFTSWRANLPKAVNLKRFKQLQGEIRSLGLGFFKLRGHWRECGDPTISYDLCPPNELEDSVEPALFVPGLELAQARRLRKKYDQDAVVYAGPETKGAVALIFASGVQKIGSFSPNRVSQAYSRLKGRSFVFEYAPQGWAESLKASSLQKAVSELRKAVDGG